MSRRTIVWCAAATAAAAAVAVTTVNAPASGAGSDTVVFELGDTGTGSR